MKTPSDPPMMLEIRKKAYKMKSFDEMTGKDWRPCFTSCERAVVEPAKLIPMLRRVIACIAPASANGLHALTDAEVLIAAGVVWPHIGELFGEFHGITEAFQQAGDIMMAQYPKLVDGAQEE